MIRTTIAIALLALASVAQATEVTPADIAACPSKWLQVTGDHVYCIKGEAWEASGRPVADPPVIITMEHGAPIATVCRTEECGKTAPQDWSGNDLPVTGCHPDPCPPPPSGRIEPNWRNYNPGH